MTFLRFGVLLALSTVTASMAMEFADPADSAILLEAAPGSKPYILRQWAVAGRLSFQPVREGGSRAVLTGCAAPCTGPVCASRAFPSISERGCQLLVTCDEGDVGRTSPSDPAL